MTRVKRSINARKKRRTVLARAKGYRGQKHLSYKRAKEQLLKSGAYAYRDRRNRKREFRRLWITRINAAARREGLTYGKFMHGLSEADVNIDRKMLADIARQRVENSSPTVNNQERSIASTPSIDPGEAAIASAMLGGTRTIRPNTGESGSNVGAVSNPSESDLLNAATPAPPQLPHLAAGPKINPVNPVTELNQSSKAIDVSPVNLLPS